MLTLEYTPTKDDQSSRTARGQGRTYLSPFLSVSGPSDFMVHGNSYVTVWEDGRDVTGQYDTWRRWRIWSLPKVGLNPSGPPDFDWKDDNLSKIPNWRDTPGYQSVAGPDAWMSQRTLLEFVVAIEEHPDAGALYFFVVVSTKPGQYRVEMSDAKSIPFAKYKELVKTKHPWAQASGCPIKVDSLWLPANELVPR
jgi:hypothetical protein